MKKLKSGVNPVNLSEDQLEDYYKEAALDALLYWTNTSISHIGSNATLTILTEMLATCIEHLVPVEQVDRAEDVVFHILEQSFDVVRSENSSQVSQKKSDKSDMN